MSPSNQADIEDLIRERRDGMERELLCTTCMKMLPESDFHLCRRLPRGRNYTCKACRKTKRSKGVDPTKNALGHAGQTGKKKCVNCGEYKKYSEFAKASHMKDGLQSWCRQCHSNYKRKKDKSTTKKGKVSRSVPIAKSVSELSMYQCPHRKEMIAIYN